MKICITGSNGLIGSTAAKHFIKKGHTVYGIDNNMRKDFFGKEADTNKQKKLLEQSKRYHHYRVDIRDREKIDQIFTQHSFDAIIHCAGQPSHDKAKDIPHLDFEVNTLGTLNLLEATRRYTPKAVFIFTSTNKVYGDNPNKIKLKELESRYTFANQKMIGINESMSIDHSIHSFMGSSKLAADIYVQEYGKNLGLFTTSLRLGCITGTSHASIELHGFLSYLVKSLVHKNKYKIIGYKGKQVRDQLDAEDVARAFEEIIKKPTQGEVFNLGGGPQNNASILELIEMISKKLGTIPQIDYVTEARTGDHICYISDISKFEKNYPTWAIKKNIETIVDEIIDYER